MTRDFERLDTLAPGNPALTVGGFADQRTKVQARLWGGQAGVAFDPNYHTPRDRLDAVNREALGVLGPGVVFVVGTYANSIDGVNGVPFHDKRHRPALRP